MQKLAHLYNLDKCKCAWIEKQWANKLNEEKQCTHTHTCTHSPRMKNEKLSTNNIFTCISMSEVKTYEWNSRKLHAYYFVGLLFIDCRGIKFNWYSCVWYCINIAIKAIYGVYVYVYFAVRWMKMNSFQLVSTLWNCT